MSKKKSKHYVKGDTVYGGLFGPLVIRKDLYKDNIRLANVICNYNKTWRKAKRTSYLRKAMRDRCK